MNLSESLIQNQDSESERAIDKYYKDNKEKLFKYPNMVPTFDPVTKKVYCVYKPRNLDELLKKMKILPKKEVDINLRKYGFWEHSEEAYKRLGIKFTKKESKKANSSSERKETQKASLSAQVNFFSFAYDTDANVFVNLLNKEAGKSYFYPINSLKDKFKLSSILHSYTFNQNIDLMYSLATYKTMKGATDENVFSIPLIQIDVDYRKIPKYKEDTPKQVWQTILDTEVGNTIPYPSAIEYGHQLRLLYKLKDLYVNQTSKASKNVARRISKVLSERLSHYGAESQPITSHGRIAGSINSKDGSTVQIELFGHEYEIESMKENWLNPLPEWYSEWKSKPKKKGKVIYLQDTITLNKSRLRDFFRIVDYFNGDLDGRRFLCFMVRSHALLAGYSPTEAREVMLDLNNHFKYPLRPNLIEQDTRNVERKQYAYRNENVLERLCITPEIEQKMKLETIISSTEKKRRDKVRKSRRYREEKYGNPNTSKRNIIEAEKKEIKNLLAEGHKRDEICTLLGIHPKTLQRRIKELSKEGFLQ